MWIETGQTHACHGTDNADEIIKTLAINTFLGLDYLRHFHGLRENHVLYPLGRISILL